MDALPAQAQSALDVGCGEGMFARELARSIPAVLGIDTHQASIDQAIAQTGGPTPEYLLADFLTYPFEDDSFDVITSIATLHHLDAPAALARMRRLLRPGGVIAILGLAGGTPLRDAPFDIAGAVAHKAYLRNRTYWEHPSPTVQTAPSYAEMRRITAEKLPGSRFRRHLLWRYSVTWTKHAGT
ncbi:class I SAM-dependent methyltransferase [Mycolicibacterium komossense]|uniref:class I SAM-dependent methyltransferase n=1 Tax=Mycolicibacterium komossense TaxID=1779 RepID=UPI0021F3BC0A|nr:class I SAM-dependent methyltransferase [Mycolicibacterium komossense]